MSHPAPTRLVIVLQDLDSGDTQRYALHLARGLDRRWFAPELWVLRGGNGFPGAARDTGVPIVRLTEGSRVGPLAVVRLALRLRRERPDLLYTLTGVPNVWGGVFAALLRIPVVSGFRSFAPQRIERVLKRFSRRIVTNAAVLRDLLTKEYGIDAAQVTVVPDGVDCGHAGPDAARRGDHPLAEARFGLGDMVRATEAVLREVAEIGSSWTTTATGDVPPEIPLRDDGASAASREKLVERGRFRPDRSLREVGSATLTAFLPPQSLASGVAAIVCPGGGYAAVTIDREGYEVGRWLASRGIAGLVLKYRIPPLRARIEDPPQPLQDITRALAAARARAGAWGFDERRVGVVGFSAGGHMAAHAASTDPNLAFAAMVYPVISMDPRITHRGSRRRLLGPRPPAAMAERYSFERRVVAGSAPTFVVHAEDDDVVPIENSHKYAHALRRAGVPHECLLVPQGGHGFGLGLAGTEAALWPERFMAWLGEVGILAPQEGPSAFS